MISADVESSLRTSLNLYRGPAAFIGSGLSNPAYPTWDIFLKNLVIESGIQYLPKELARASSIEEKLMVAQIAKDVLAREGRFENFMARMFSGKEPPPVFAPLVTLPFSFYITTNYDTNIETAFEQYRGKSLEVVLPSKARHALELLSDDQPFVFKIHGCALRGESLVGLSEYEELLGRQSPVLEIVRVLLTVHTVLIAGYSMADLHIRTLLSSVSQLSAHRTKRFYFYRQQDAGVLKESTLRTQGLEPVPVESYAEVEEIVQQLSFTQLRDNYAQIRQRLAGEFEAFVEKGDIRCAWGALFYARASSEIGLAEDCLQLQTAVEHNAVLKKHVERKPALHAMFLLVAGQFLKRALDSKGAKECFDRLFDLINKKSTAISRPVRALALRYIGIFLMWPPDQSEQDWQRAETLLQDAENILENRFEDERMDIRKTKAGMLWGSGKRDEAIALLREVAEQAEEIGYKENAAWSLYNVIYYWYELHKNKSPDPDPLGEHFDLLEHVHSLFKSLGHLQGLSRYYRMSARLRLLRGDANDLCRRDAEMASAYAVIANLQGTQKSATRFIEKLSS